jgi:hypothetical protein
MHLIFDLISIRDYKVFITLNRTMTTLVPYVCCHKYIIIFLMTFQDVSEWQRCLKCVQIIQ